MDGLREILKKHCRPLAFLALAIALFFAAGLSRSITTNPKRVAARAERKIEKRVKKLDACIEEMMQVNGDAWTEIAGLPDDMVLYRYVCDTLQCWNHEFPVMNDDIRARMKYQRISRPEFEFSTPLNNIGEELSYVNLGPKWYLAKWAHKGELVEVIAAIEVMSTDAGGDISSLNRHLGIPKDFAVYPIAGNGGTIVNYQGQAMFSIVSETATATYLFGDSPLRWLALLTLILAAMHQLAVTRKWRDFIIAGIVIVLAYAVASIWGLQMQENSTLFSPVLYAGRGIWHSFGLLISLNLAIFLFVYCIFLMRHRLLDSVKAKPGSIFMWIYCCCIVIGVAGIITYLMISTHDLMSNSGITPEIQWYRDNLGYSALALSSYGMLLLAMMLLLYMLSPAIRFFTEKKMRFFTLGSISAGALVFTLFIFTLSTNMGFKKELSKVSVWANRLAVDRNLALELQIRSVENAIANDQFIPSFADLDDCAGIIENEVTSQYFANIAADYFVAVSVCNNDDRECNAIFNSKLAGGTQIAPDSRFFCNYDNNGRSSYAGTFMFVSKNGKLVRMLVELVSRASKEDNGYYSIFDMLSKPGDVVMPEIYSYAKFIDGRIASYKGGFAYPTVIAEPFSSQLEAGKKYFKKDGYIHFLKQVSADETIIISRHLRGFMGFATSFLSIFAVIFLMQTPLLRYGRTKEKTGRRTFKRRLRWTLTLTVSCALVFLAFVSVKFVFDRNKIDSDNVMSEKISAIQTIVESRCQGIVNLRQVEKTEWMNLLQNVAGTTRSDLTLFTPSGVAFVSTVGEMYDRALLNCRMDGKAYKTIVRDHQRICINRESAGGKNYYALYAPILSIEGQTLAIVCTPFNRDAEIMRDVLPHAILLIILLVAIIIISSTVASHIINRIFKPLAQVSSKMQAAGTSGLEYIQYDQDDEISTLVDSYNRMVHDLEESNRILAQNEREQAWTAMARQVAHEIKNPLTPISLQIQKLMYLKKNNDPTWTDKFDDSARIIIEQIRILADTANEFSTFAKLYTEDPVAMNLDQVLQDQITLYSNKENIEMTYLGFKDSDWFGPKPQIIRVFVNLLTNATQAIEILQNDAVKNGNEPKTGQIRMELRNDAENFEISVEDNGPGVPEENLSKMFEPNFTTKSGGTGLGLAISRSIVEKCNGTISYKKSFTLGGACFTVRLPKSIQKDA